MYAVCAPTQKEVSQMRVQVTLRDVYLQTSQVYSNGQSNQLMHEADCAGKVVCNWFMQHAGLLDAQVCLCRRLGEVSAADQCCGEGGGVAGCGHMQGMGR